MEEYIMEHFEKCINQANPFTVVLINLLAFFCLFDHLFDLLWRQATTQEAAVVEGELGDEDLLLPFFLFLFLFLFYHYLRLHAHQTAAVHLKGDLDLGSRRHRWNAGKGESTKGVYLAGKELLLQQRLHFGDAS
ncbi:hypothetical protein TYRP_023655 [Tyrophagus putrescentiae]|nr:hypothetical protein TYRP_023655 [Tyrophagus putrescentiae]